VDIAGARAAVAWWKRLLVLCWQPMPCQPGTGIANSDLINGDCRLACQQWMCCAVAPALKTTMRVGCVPFTRPEIPLQGRPLPSSSCWEAADARLYSELVNKGFVLCTGVVGSAAVPEAEMFLNAVREENLSECWRHARERSDWV
jgi:hypothetical protein